MANKPGKSGSSARPRAAFGADPEAAGSELPSGRVVDETGLAAPSEASAAAAEAIDQMVQAPDPLSTLAVPPDLLAAKEALVDSLAQSFASFASFGADAAQEDPLHPLNNVVGFAVGLRFTEGKITGDLAVKCFVRKKAPPSRLDPALMLPPQVDGLPTDIVESGPFAAQQSVAFSQMEQPARCGSSVGHFAIGSGTLGCLVPHPTLAEACYILSNNHVLANSNGGQPGDLIFQPGRGEAGPRQELAKLARFVPIKEAPNPPGFNAPQNRVDCALAITRRTFVNSSHHNFTMNPSPVQAAPFLPVCKEGRTTGFTFGHVTDVAGTIFVAYEVFQNGFPVRRFQGLFVNQIVVESFNNTVPFSLGGDSGSVVVTTGTKQPIGLLFAGTPPNQPPPFRTLVNPIAAVMQELNFNAFLV